MVDFNQHIGLPKNWGEKKDGVQPSELNTLLGAVDTPEIYKFYGRIIAVDTATNIVKIESSRKLAGLTIGERVIFELLERT